MTDQKGSELPEVAAPTSDHFFYVFTLSGGYGRLDWDNFVLPNNSVALGKLEQVPAGTIIGRVSATTGDVEEFTVEGLVEKTDPATGDWLIVRTQEGEFQKLDPTNISVAYSMLPNMDNGKILARNTAGTGATEAVSDTDLTEETTPTTGHKLLAWVGGALRKVDVGNLPTGGGGEANTNTNAGTGAQVAKTKTGVDTPLRSIVGGTGITATQNTDDITLDASGVPLTSLANVSSGSIIGRQTSGSGSPEELTATQARTVLQIPWARTITLYGPTENIVTGTSLDWFDLDDNVVLTEVSASCMTAPGGADVVVDVNAGAVGGPYTTILSGKCTISAGDLTSIGGGGSTISSPNHAKNKRFVFDVDSAGASGTPGQGLKVTLYGYRV